nr:reverse transcriptase domain-containing protein [Tanacetum cinerariifolium]
RPFLRTARSLVNVYGEELILRDGDEELIFHADSTLKHPHKHGNESINMINFIDITYEDRFEEVLKMKKSNHPFSGSTTSLFDSLPSLTPFETSDSLLEDLAKALALMPKYHKMLNDLLSDKEKLLGMANSSLTENYPTVLLKKLPEKLGDPGKFLIPCDFSELEKC